MQPRTRRGQLQPTAAGASATSTASTAPASTASASRANGSWSPNDEVQLGRTHLLFVEDMRPAARPAAAADDAARRRVHQEAAGPDALPDARSRPEPRRRRRRRDAGPPPRHALSRDLSLLYRLALDMGSASTYEELCRIVLDALLEAIPAEVGAILTVARPGNGRGRRDELREPATPASRCAAPSWK